MLHISYQYLTPCKNTYEVKFQIVYTRIPHIYKIPPKSVAFCIRFQLFTILSPTSMTIRYQFIICAILCYQCFTCVRIWYDFFSLCEFWYQFLICVDLLPIFYMLGFCTVDSSHEWGLGNDSSQLWKFGTNYSHRTCSSHKWNLITQILHPPPPPQKKMIVIDRNKFHIWKVTYFTMCANSSHGLKYEVWNLRINTASYRVATSKETEAIKLKECVPKLAMLLR